MLNRRALQRINNRPKQVNRLPLLVVGAGALAAAGILYALLGLSMFALAALLASALGVLGVYRAQKTRSVTTLNYDGLSDKTRAHFSGVQEACEALSSSQMIWRLRGGAAQWTSRDGDAAPSPPREPVRVGLLETPGIRANAPIWGIDALEAKVFFFPEAVLIYRDKRYEGASYESLKVSLSCARFYEKKAVPDDAEVVARSGRSRLPVVLSGLLEISLPRGLKVSLQVSSRDVAARFARAFGVQETRQVLEEDSYEEQAEGGSTAFGALTVAEREKAALAWKTLGVRVGASMSEVSAAYKQMARIHHPDKVANLYEEDREVSQRKTKDINAAYTELKHMTRNLT